MKTGLCVARQQRAWLTQDTGKPDMELCVNTRKATLKIAAVLLLATGCIALSSCSMFHRDEKLPLHYSAVESPELQVPESLARPSSSGAFVIATPAVPLPQEEIRAFPPRVDSTSTDAQTGSAVRWSAGVVYLSVKDFQASVFRRLGIVVTRSGMSLLNTIGDSGYSFAYRHDPKSADEGFFGRFFGAMAFWRDKPPNYSGNYEAVTQAEGQNTRVYIKNADGADADPNAAEHLLEILGIRLG
jgi:uncharacterized lipoprotein